MRQSAAAIRSDQPLSEQTEAVRRFFDRAAAAFHRLTGCDAPFPDAPTTFQRMQPARTPESEPRRVGGAPHARLRQWARTVKRDVLALWFAARDPRVPWYAKALALVVAGYALSPIDLIPDFIPVLGYLDDVILVPAGILLVRRLIPAELLAEHRALADRAAERPTSRTAAVVIVGVWLAALALAVWLAWPRMGAWIGRGEPPTR